MRHPPSKGQHAASPLPIAKSITVFSFQALICIILIPFPTPSPCVPFILVSRYSHATPSPCPPKCASVFLLCFIIFVRFDRAGMRRRRQFIPSSTPSTMGHSRRLSTRLTTRSTTTSTPRALPSTPTTTVASARERTLCADGYYRG